MNRTQLAAQAQDEAYQKFAEMLQNPADHYLTPRVEGEIDLVEIVRERFMNAGLGEKLASTFDNNRFIVEARDKTSAAQQYNLNRWLALQFMACQHDTSVQRYALMYNVNALEWLTVFDRAILPAIIDFDLPVAV